MTESSDSRGNRQSTRGLTSLSGCLLLMAATYFTYLPAAVSTLWTSDDYAQVYGLDGRPVPTAIESLHRGGGGRITSQRLLNFPWTGYVPWLLGPVLSHVLQLTLHVLCGVTLWSLLRKLAFGSSAALWAALFFLLSPWVIQPVMWWSSSTVLLHTWLALSSACLYVDALKAPRSRWLMFAAICVMFLSLLIYELWICGWLMFWGIAWYRLRQENPRPLGWIKPIRQATLDAAPMLIPFVIWSFWYLLAPPLHESWHKPVTDPIRWVVVFFSVQLRSIQWISTTPWLYSWSRAGRDHLSLTGGIVTVAAIAAIVFWRRIRATGQDDSGPFENDRLELLLERLVLAWFIFLGSRLIFMLQGGISLDTRVNYGGAIGWAVAFASFGECFASLGKRKLVRSLQLGIVILMGAATMGMAHDYAYSSRLEESAFQAILTDLEAEDREFEWVFVLGAADDSRGEMPFYFEGAGRWLQFRLQSKYPDIEAAATPRLDEFTPRLEFRGNPPDERSWTDLPREETAIYELRSDGSIIRQDWDFLADRRND